MSRSRTPEVQRLDRRDAARMGDVLGRAFNDTEQWALLLPDPAVRQRKLQQMFKGTAKLAHAAGGFVERTTGFEACAVWIPPGRSVGFVAMLKSGFASARFVVTPPFPNVRRLTRTLGEFDKSHAKYMPDPHWYLMALGVDPIHQSRGYGSTLVAAGIRRANTDNLPIYLETETGANTSCYEKLGFEVLAEITIDAIDLPFSLMIYRPARPG